MKRAIPPAVLEQHLGILGKTGRGKTNTGKVCIEQVFDEDFRVCVLDPIKSDWWGITSSADGKRAGLPFYILGGPHAHLPLASSSGKAVADLVARGQLRHTIIDMANFEPGGQMRWFSEFAPRLMQRMKGVLYLVMEEAHLFAPKERAGMGHENLSIHWAKMLATAGRTKGIRMLVLSQRTQAVHNALLGSLDSMIVHGMTAPADMLPVVNWLKANNKDKALNATIEGSLSGLPKGEGWLCSSEAGIFERVQFPKARTYDNTATPEDDAELLQVKTAPVDVEQLRAILGKAAEEAEANDPGVLRKRIAELDAQLRKPTQSATDLPLQLIAAEEKGYKKGLTMGQQNTAVVLQHNVATERNRARDYLSKALGAIDALRDDVSRAYLAYNADQANGNELVPPATMTKLLQEGMAARPEPTIEYSMELRAAKRKDPIKWTVTKDDEEGTTVRQNPSGLRLRILAALRWLEDRGITPAPRATLGGVADFTADKGYGARTLGEMKTEGLITFPAAGLIELTPEGRHLAPEPPQFASLYDAWRARLSGLHRDILVALAEAHPRPVSRESLSEALEKQFEKGYGARVLGELKTMGAIHYPQPGLLQLTKHAAP